MTAFVPPLAPLVVLAFLGTAALLAVAAVVFLYAVVAKRRRLIFGVILGVSGLLVFYGGSLLAASALSRDQVLLPGEKKYFCEIDCHLAYSLVGVEVAQELGTPSHLVQPTGQFLVVTLRTWFDESTISPRRPKDATLDPNPRVIYIEDAQGRRFEPSPAGESALAATGRASTPITQPLRPGDSYTTCFVFDLPADARDPRLFLGDAPGVEFLLIGHEMSPWHRRVWFALK
ncbi:MAG TPA: hypothetical protein VJQ53_08295 [Candidatus Eisenbacteria bacterium]|nr:hypothetical protein [Candidatus Eisenbacteria bacterium]